jgi:hypothetical protein
MTALGRISSSCKQQTRPLIREGAPHQQTRNYLTVIKIWSLAPGGCLTTRQTSRLTVGRNATMILNFVEEQRPLLEDVTKQRSEDSD